MNSYDEDLAELHMLPDWLRPPHCNCCFPAYRSLKNEICCSYGAHL
jgi:hypothetical protein